MDNPNPTQDITLGQPPRGLTTASLLFWGLSTGQWPIALLLSAALEAPGFGVRRIDLDEQDLRRVGQLVTLLVIGAVLTAFNTNDGLTGARDLLNPGGGANQSEALRRVTQSIGSLYQWLPIVLSPVAWAGAWSLDARIPWSSLWWPRSKPPTSTDPSRAANYAFRPGSAYVLACLIGASASLAAGAWYLPASTAIGALLAWPRRSRRHAAPEWIAYVAIVLTATVGLSALYRAAERKANELYLRWIQQIVQNTPEPREARTSMGSIGRIKNSGLTRFRVVATPDTPPLLREATYNSFRVQTWYPTHRNNGAMVAQDDGVRWVLSPAVGPRSKEVTVRLPLPNRKGLLPLPLGTHAIHSTGLTAVETNRLGFVLATEAAGFLEYTARFQNTTGLDAPPDADDLQVPSQELLALERIALRLRRTNASPAALSRAVDRFFSEGFQYSLNLTPQDPKALSPVADFLERTRSGHCEYFASATVLLLRQLGVPARYAVGWSVQEQVGPEFRVRDRHAHAWCIAFWDGAWHDVDTTPASWQSADQQRAGWWEPILDGITTLHYEFTRWRWGQGSIRPYLMAVVWCSIGLLVIAAVLRRRTVTRSLHSQSGDRVERYPGQDSEFLVLLNTLSQEMGSPSHQETLTGWLQGQFRDRPELLESLQKAMELHWRYRFDPLGVTAEERLELKAACEALSRRLHTR